MLLTDSNRNLHQNQVPPNKIVIFLTLSLFSKRVLQKLSLFTLMAMGCQWPLRSTSFDGYELECEVVFELSTNRDGSADALAVRRLDDERGARCQVLEEFYVKNVFKSAK